MAIKYANVIINDIKTQNAMITSNASANGEDFEKWLYEEDIPKVFFPLKKRIFYPVATENEYQEFYGDAA